MIDNVKQLESAERSGERIGLVLSGGAARGAYELGVLSVLAPALERRGERPTIIVGTSAGGLNAAFLASEAQEGLVSAVESGSRMWRELEYGDVLGPLLSPRELRRAMGYGLEFLGVAAGSMPSVLDNTPLADTIKARISFDRLAENVRAGVIETAAVVATSYDTGRSVVFHDGGSRPPRDDLRGIDYARTRLAATHVRASSAIGWGGGGGGGRGRGGGEEEKRGRGVGGGGGGGARGGRGGGGGGGGGRGGGRGIGGCWGKRGKFGVLGRKGGGGRGREGGTQRILITE